MLHEFLTLNRDELIGRCRSKARQRNSPPATPFEVDHGVPLFLDQLVDALRDEQSNLAPGATVMAGNGGTAALHGRELLLKGYSVEQVVHGYGDICQATTELAQEKDAPVTIDEFHTFNRLLDNAIADAVASYGRHQTAAVIAHGAHELHERIGSLAEEQRAQLGTALRALDALKVGNIGLMGATGTVLEDSLLKLRDLIDMSLPQIRLSTGMTSPPQS